jgi:hypothetical protein
MDERQLNLNIGNIGRELDKDCPLPGQGEESTNYFFSKTKTKTKVYKLTELLWWIKGFTAVRGFDLLTQFHIQVLEDVICELKETIEGKK